MCNMPADAPVRYQPLGWLTGAEECVTVSRSDDRFR